MNYDFIYNSLFLWQLPEILQRGIFMTYLKLGKRLFTIWQMQMQKHITPNQTDSHNHDWKSFLFWIVILLVFHDLQLW